MTDVRGVAAWDFDGTITERDTLGGFLVHLAGRRKVGAALARHSAALGRGLRDDAARDAAKELVIGDLVRGRSVDDVVAAGRSYAEQLPRRFRSEALERIEWHRTRAHEQVIVSASLVYYLEPLAEQLGFVGVLGVELAADEDGRCTGRFDRPNVRAEQKAMRLREWLDGHDGAPRQLELWAYGNSSGDDHLLAMADHPTWMGRRAGRPT